MSNSNKACDPFCARPQSHDGPCLNRAEVAAFLAPAPAMSAMDQRIKDATRAMEARNAEEMSRPRPAGPIVGLDAMLPPVTPAAMLGEALEHIQRARDLIRGAAHLHDDVAERADNDLEDALQRVAGLRREAESQKGAASSAEALIYERGGYTEARPAPEVLTRLSDAEVLKAVTTNRKPIPLACGYCGESKSAHVPGKSHTYSPRDPSRKVG